MGSAFAPSNEERLEEVAAAVLAPHAHRNGIVEISDEGTWRFTWGELLEQAERRATRLKDLGLEPGDRVLVCGANCAGYVTAVLAILRCRCTAVLLDPSLDTAGISKLVGKAEARLALVTRETSGKFPQGTPTLDMDGEMAPLSPDCGRPLQRPASAPELDSTEKTALILFTSGTEGIPKGVMLSHGAVLRRTFKLLDWLHITEPRRLLGIVPMHHVYGFIVLLTCSMMSGSSTILLRRVDASLLQRALREEHPSWFPGVPRAFVALRDKILHTVRSRGLLVVIAFRLLMGVTRFLRKRLGVGIGRRLFASVHRELGGALRDASSAGADLPAEVTEFFLDLDIEIVNAYGLSETTGGGSLDPPSGVVTGAAGVALPGEELRLLNPDVQGYGELAIRSNTVFDGYFRDPESTRRSLVAGWLRTGDLCSIDRFGRVRVHGRLKELIVLSSGKKVSPDELDERYQNMPAVKELSCFGAPAPDGSSEQIHCAVVPQASDEQGRREALRQVLARSESQPPMARVSRIHLLEALPRTSTLKVKRTELRRRVKEGELADRNAPGVAGSESGAEQGPTLAAVVGIVEYLVRAEYRAFVSADAHLGFDLGFDSLAMMELRSELQSCFGVALYEMPATPRQVATAIEQAKRSPGVSDERSPQAHGDKPEPVELPAAPSRRLWGLLRSGLHLGWSLEVEGLEHLPKEGPYILCPNHQSHLDSPVVCSLLPATHRSRICLVAKKELVANRLSLAVGAALGALPIDREADPHEMLRACEAALHSGRIVLMHPEGSRTRDGRPLPVRRGAYVLARRTGVPLVPARIEGTFEVFASHMVLPRSIDWKRGKRYRLKVTFGKPLDATADPSPEGEREFMSALARGMFGEQTRGSAAIDSRNTGQA
jgi:long-chain acyl-CoA synthetase